MRWLLAWILAGAAALPAAFSAREKLAPRHITAHTLAAHVRFLADDLLEGRAPASRGSELGLRYIAAEYERIGLVPAGDDDERYHRPGDQIDATWNLDGAVEDVQLMTVALMRVADAPKMPQWRRGDEFEAARKRALAVVEGTR